MIVGWLPRDKGPKTLSRAATSNLGKTARRTRFPNLRPSDPGSRIGNLITSCRFTPVADSEGSAHPLARFGRSVVQMRLSAWRSVSSGAPVLISRAWGGHGSASRAMRWATIGSASDTP